MSARGVGGYPVRLALIRCDLRPHRAFPAVHFSTRSARRLDSHSGSPRAARRCNAHPGRGQPPGVRNAWVVQPPFPPYISRRSRCRALRQRRGQEWSRELPALAGEARNWRPRSVSSGEAGAIRPWPCGDPHAPRLAAAASLPCAAPHRGHLNSIGALMLPSLVSGRAARPRYDARSSARRAAPAAARSPRYHRGVAAQRQAAATSVTSA